MATYILVISNICPKLINMYYSHMLHVYIYVCVYRVDRTIELYIRMNIHSSTTILYAHMGYVYSCCSILLKLYRTSGYNIHYTIYVYIFHIYIYNIYLYIN